jgi:hypothetical protein
MASAYEGIRTNLISTIVANGGDAEDKFTAEELAKFDTPMLRKLAAVAGAKKTQAAGNGTFPNFSGMAVPLTNETAPVNLTPLKAPKYDFASRNKAAAK